MLQDRFGYRIEICDAVSFIIIAVTTGIVNRQKSYGYMLTKANQDCFTMVPSPADLLKI
jgi:hypothetical protein